MPAGKLTSAAHGGLQAVSALVMVGCCQFLCLPASQGGAGGIERLVGAERRQLHKGRWSRRSRCRWHVVWGTDLLCSPSEGAAGICDHAGR